MKQIIAQTIVVALPGVVTSIETAVAKRCGEVPQVNVDDAAGVVLGQPVRKGRTRAAQVNRMTKLPQPGFELPRLWNSLTRMSAATFMTLAWLFPSYTIGVEA